MTLGNDWLAIAWAQMWQVTILIVIVALLARLTAANRPQLAFALWLVVLLKCVTPPLWSSPSGAFCWLQPSKAGTGDYYAAEGDGGGCREKTSENGRRVADNLLRPPVGQRTIVVGTIADDVFGSHDSSSLPVKRPELTQIAAAQEKNGDVLPHSENLTPQPASVLASLWLAGAIVVFAWTAWRQMRFAWLLRRANRVENPLGEDILADLRYRLRLRRRVRLIVTDRLVGPAAFGLLRPTVLLPQAVVEGKSAGEIELILAHELIHVRRGDLWFGLLRSAVELVWWFHPLVWWAARRASREAERCCDEAVLAELQCGPSRYARCLLDVLEAKHRLRSAPACPGVRAIEITQGRLERIMSIGQRGYRRTPWWCWGIAILAAGVVVPGAAIGTLDEKKDAAAPASAPSRSPALAKSDAVPKKDAAPTRLTPEAADKPVITGLREYERLLQGKAAEPRSVESRPSVSSRRSKASASEAATPPPDHDDKWRVESRNEPTLAPPRSRYADELTQPYARDRYSSRSSSPKAVYRETVMQQRQVFRDGVATYLVEDILQTIDKERGLSRPKSVDYLKRLLKARVGQLSLSQFIAGVNATIPAPVGGGASGPVPTDFNSPTADIVWRGDSFEIETTADGHRRIGQALANIRSHGIGQIRMDVRFLTGPAEEFKKAKLNWVVSPSELTASAAANVDAGSNAALPVDDFMDGGPGPRVNRVQFVTEKTPPMIYDILTEDVAATLLEQWYANKQVNNLKSPKMTIFNGQLAFVHDCSQTPFVVAVKDGKPQIRVVHEGTMLQFRPLAEEADKLKVDFQVEFSKIGTVETAELSTKYEGKPITIQVPEVSKTRVEGSVSLPWNQWLLLGGVEALNGGKKPIMVVMMRAEKIEPFKVPAKQGLSDEVAMPGPAVGAVAMPGPVPVEPARYPDRAR